MGKKLISPTRRAPGPQSRAIAARPSWLLTLLLIAGGSSPAAYAGPQSPHLTTSPGLATTSIDTIKLAILPATLTVDPGTTFTVELTIVEEGLPFNAFDLYIGYEPDHLIFQETDPPDNQIGPLMLDACPNHFHRFEVAEDSMSLTVNFSLLCAGVTVSGPGVIYRLTFQSGPDNASTQLSILPTTRFYDDGVFVTPLVTSNATITIGAGTPVPDAGDLPAVDLSVAPNPFNPQTLIRFEVPEDRPVSVRVFALDGRLVRLLVDDYLPAGPQVFPWNGCDDAGRRVASGCYTAVVGMGGDLYSQNVMLVK